MLQNAIYKEFITFDNIMYIILGLVILSIILLIWNIKLEIRLKRLMKGKNGNSLEDSFISMQKDILSFENFRVELNKYLNGVEKRIQRNISGIGNIDFNAFSGMESGGKSFATAFLNENGTGIVISSLNARGRITLLIKEINNYKSSIELTEEENLALTKAKESCKV